MTSASRRLLMAVIGLGVVLRLWQYAANSSLWIDEISIALNVRDRSLWTLLASPLAYTQVAPRGFLLAEKVAVAIFGVNEYAFRLFPLVSALVALVAFGRLATRMLDGYGPLVATALFATARPLIFHAGTVKQYSTDVAVTTLVVLLTLNLAEGTPTRRRVMWAGTVGAIAVWFSQPAVLVLGACGLVLIWHVWRTRSANGAQRALVTTVAVWGASSLLAMAAELATVTPQTRAYMRGFWAAGFPPPSLHQILASLWPLNCLSALFGMDTGFDMMYPLPWLYTGVIGLGLWALRRRSIVFALLLTPIAMTVAVAAARQYPFRGRLILFLLPVLLITIGAAAEWLSQQWRPRSIAAWATLLAIVGAGVYPVIARPPVYRIDDVKPVFAYLRSHLRPTDAIYMYYGADRALQFYRTRYGLTEAGYTLGGCHRGQPRRYLEELDVFRGQPRVWVVFARARPTLRERETIVRYLDAIGMRRDAFATLYPGGSVSAQALLYDLSDQARLAAATAASQRIMVPAERTGCGDL